MPAYAVFILLLLSLALVSCGGHRPVVPIRDDTVVSRQPESEYRMVLHGDTLYSIAWESGQDYHDLAAWNHLPRPYTIVPGQRLRLYPPKDNGRPQGTTPPPTTAAKKPIAPQKPPKPPPRPTLAVPVPKPLPPMAKALPPPPAAPPSAPKAPLGANFAWAWPAEGKIVRNFTDGGSVKGLDIAGIRGQPVRAAANGRVVYQGSGLRGYGQLIIIKHNDEFLSAYAHNERIYIKEGDSVKRGARIASMGDSGTDRVQLHFEVRRNGKPVDPLKYLPQR